MPIDIRQNLRGVVIAVVLALAGFSAAPAAQAAQPLETGVFDPASFESQSARLAFDRTVDAGAKYARIWVGWNGIAPRGESKPSGFSARDPLDPGYYWDFLDREIVEAKAAGLTPILMVVVAPNWAERHRIPRFKRGTGKPRPSDYGDFALAAARRYSGDFPGLPRVRYWQAWNEPNLSGYLTPQYDTPLDEPVRADSKPLSPDVYRPLVNAFANAVHRVHRDNVVIGGGTSPVGKYERWAHAVPPLMFARNLLCMSRKNRPLRRCKTPPVRFDVWSTHPYTQGGPTHSSPYPDNVSLGDLPELARLIRAADRAGRIVSRRKVQLWVTEFSWDTKPPDPEAVPIKLHARWTAEALYRMWRAGVTVATWFQLRDDHRPDIPKTREITSGLYFRCADGLECDRPKRSLAAFRFPFVAFRGKRSLRVWGRVPPNAAGPVVVEQRRGKNWRSIARLTPNRHGIFSRKLRRTRGRYVRAVAPTVRSVPFSLKRPPDLRVFPFGGNPCERSESEPGLCK